MGFTVFFSAPDITEGKGFGKVARIPCIFDMRPGYHRLGSQYLIDRGIGIWHPQSKGSAYPSRKPTETTLKNYAFWLANFLEWTENRGIDLCECNYHDHVHGRYQEEMLSGMWSRDNRKLSPTTINLRVQQACDFLSWMSDKGLRAPFTIPFRTTKARIFTSNNSQGHILKTFDVRIGRVRQDKRLLRMPTDQQVNEWLSSVYSIAGDTAGLMCETVLCTGLRREEVACLRVDTLPLDPKDWHLNRIDAPISEQAVRIRISYGAKGPSYGMDHGDKIGPSRSIWIPRSIADRLHTYRTRQRLHSLRTFVRQASSASEQRILRDSAVHLFLCDSTGARITGKGLYASWVSGSLPFKGWSPHLGRDWWACSVLWQEIKRHDHFRHMSADSSVSVLSSAAVDIIRLRIQPQLGHSHESTTHIYLSWISDMLGFGLDATRSLYHTKN
jgi:integrase